MDIHLIGNAHLDPVWLWRWQEGFAEVKATFRSALERMKEFPDFVFTCAAAAIYEWVEENDPDMFAEIKQRVDEGRWAVTGGWWIQADCNLPSGESFVRQALYAQRYFHSRFGVRCRCGYCVDSFGHCASLPKILRGCGLTGWVWMRPQEHENPDIPMPLFRWQADDGSEVLAMRISHQGYTAWSVEDLEQRIRDIHERYAETGPGSAQLCFFGVGNHGGGPTVEQLQVIERRRSEGKEPRLLYSSPERFQDLHIAADLPTYRGELQHHASGCYAAVSLIKSLNRQAETRLAEAEAWSAAARMAVGKKAPTAELARAWKHVLFNQFHDIMAGTSLEESYEDARHQIGGAIHTADYARNSAQQAVSWQVDTRGHGAPLFVFNNLPVPFSGVVETEDFGFGALPGTPQFTDDAGRPVPAQTIRAHSEVGGTGAARRRAVLQLDLPPLGYRLLRLREADRAPSAPAQPTDSVRAEHRLLENRNIRLRIRPNGCIALLDRNTGRQVLKTTAGAGGCLVVPDPSDTWSHGVFRFDGQGAAFTLVRTELVEDGPIRGRIRARFRYGESLLTLDYTLGAGERFVGIDGEIDWRGRESIVKLVFPLRFAAREHTAEIPYGSLVRPNNGEEEPMQRWVDVSGRSGGLSVANDCKYSYDARDNTLRITLLRSPVYAHHLPTQLEQDREYRVTDQGRQRFRLRLMPHAGDWRKAGVVATALQLNSPPNTLFETEHPGALGPVGSFLQWSSPGIAPGAFKSAESGDGLVLRVAESLGRPTRCRFTLPATGHSWTRSFRGGEIRTFLVPPEREAPVQDTSMLEETL